MVLIATPSIRTSPDSGADGCTGKPAHPDDGVASAASFVVSVLEGVTAGGEERLLQRLSAVAPLQLVGRLQAEQLAVVEDPDAVGEGFGLGQVVRAEQDGGVVLSPHLADELLHLL